MNITERGVMQSLHHIIASNFSIIAHCFVVMSYFVTWCRCWSLIVHVAL